MSAASPATWAIVVAGGTGSRFGGPKQFAELRGRPLVEWSLDAARRACGGVVLVLPEAAGDWGADTVVAGGATRSASVRAGLRAVPADARVIVVHDAARPLAADELWRAVISEVEAGADAAIPACPVTDTIKKKAAGGALVTLDRSELFAVQTPQAFDAAALRKAHEGEPDATDDAALVEACGGKVTLVASTHDNLKITSPTDLVLAAALLEARA